ncbi:uncharacterized protein LOC112691564 isoform X2 [Sipha flava]|nr:uncharacterized protein LOC112691564 isoform X2 [Sipha flava]XP_025421640.1 uncharacterized protein LOC112691564 isoform X2 [Sipha flava]
MLSAVVLVVLAGLSQPRIGTDAAPSEGLTPFGFLMARAYGEPAEHQVMRFIAFKPSDGAKFRETFEKKHGPRGRDLIDSLGRGLYRTPTDQDPGAPVIADGASGKASVKNPVSGAERAKQQ